MAKFLYLLLILPCIAFGEIKIDWKTFCSTALVNWKHEDVFSLSDNQKFMVISNIYGTKIYEKDNKDFIEIGEIEDTRKSAKHIFVSDLGNILFLGARYTLTETDVMYLYNKKGQRMKSFSASDVLSKKQIEKGVELYSNFDGCTPVSPWICWDDGYWLEEDSLTFTDVLGARVKIDLNKAEIRRTASDSSCEMFNEKP